MLEHFEHQKKIEHGLRNQFLQFSASSLWASIVIEQWSPAVAFLSGSDDHPYCSSFISDTLEGTWCLPKSFSWQLVHATRTHLFASHATEKILCCKASTSKGLSIACSRKPPRTCSCAAAEGLFACLPSDSTCWVNCAAAHNPTGQYKT